MDQAARVFADGRATYEKSLVTRCGQQSFRPVSSQRARKRPSSPILSGRGSKQQPPMQSPMQPQIYTQSTQGAEPAQWPDDSQYEFNLQFGSPSIPQNIPPIQLPTQPPMPAQDPSSIHPQIYTQNTQGAEPAQWPDNSQCEFNLQFGSPIQSQNTQGAEIARWLASHLEFGLTATDTGRSDGLMA